jgi:hypothetical protein
MRDVGSRALEAGGVVLALEGAAIVSRLIMTAMSFPVQAAAEVPPVVVLVCGKCPNQRRLASFTLAVGGTVIGMDGRRRLRFEEVPDAASPDLLVLHFVKGGAPPGRNYRCHKRCGANWTISRDELKRAVLERIAAGDRRPLVAGIDL